MSSISSPNATPLSYNTQDPTPPITLVLTILFLAMFFVGMVSIYFCKCFMDNLIHSLNIMQPPNVTAPIEPTPIPLGLDSSIVNSFPTFPYSSVKDYQCEKYGQECAICLCDFDDHHLLRLLTICYHVFHQDCIDLWFESHKSCPVCRRDLDELIKEKTSQHNTSPITHLSNGTNETDGNQERSEDVISIVVKDDNQIGHDSGKGSSLIIRNGHKPYVNYEKFFRSHSTGHSIFKDLPSLKNDDKYKLRLPQHVKETIIRRHNASLSCTIFGEYSTLRGSSEKHMCSEEISECTS